MRILRALGIDADFFDITITGSDVSRIKPDLEPFRRVLNALNVDSEQILMIGDRIELDLQPARRLNMKTALITPNINVCKNDAVDFILHKIHDLVSIL